jgi:hypothetical protein
LRSFQADKHTRKGARGYRVDAQADRKREFSEMGRRKAFGGQGTFVLKMFALSRGIKKCLPRRHVFFVRKKRNGALENQVLVH